jgi:hypothetical protein
MIHPQKITDNIGKAHEGRKCEDDHPIGGHRTNEALNVDFPTAFFVKPDQILLRALKSITALIV